MKTLIKEAHLETNIYTNHSICATCIGKKDDNKFKARHITAISGHKNELTIKTYSTKWPDSKKRQMYEALKESFIPKKQRNEPCVTTSKLIQQDSVPDLPMIRVNDVQDLDLNQNNSNNSDLPSNFQFIPIDINEDSDDFRLEYVNSDPQVKQLENPTMATIMSKTMKSSSFTTTMPIIPKMFFPN